jgi:hypothetical protein
MSNQDSRETRQGGPRKSENLSSKTDDLISTASAMAGAAASKVGDVASETAGTVSAQVTQLLDRQVGAGAHMVEQVARSAKRAAEELDQETPQLANLVRTFAGQIDGYAENLRDQSVNDLMRSASDFTRRQPALVFGAAALAGFFALRMIKSSSPISAPSIQPTDESGHERTRTSNGIRAS